MIKKVTHPYAYELRQARIDEAIVTGRPLVERPYYYENVDTGQQYYDLFGCIGWPYEDEDNKKGLPGYVAVIGVVKQNGDGTGTRAPEKAWFRLMGEAESEYLIVLFQEIQQLRDQFGFGEHPELLKVFVGDPDKNITDLVSYNAWLERDGNKKREILFAPPLDMYDDEAFDNYKRSLETAIMTVPERFAFGGNSILRTKHHEYRRNNPAIFAIGGLIHTLLHTTPWMDQQQEGMFVVQEGV